MSLNKKNKIVFAINDFTVAGAQRLYLDLFNQFEIYNIKINKGTLLDLIDNLNGNLDLWDYLTELAIKQIEENE
jgi:hypothetical protein